MRPAARLAAATAAAGVAMLAAITPGYAHKPITSPYTFAADVGPILREHCSGCHVSGGIAPMSLATYEDALPWAESMRVELVAGHMPPSGVEAGASRFRNVKPLTARELNVLLTWASGGTPPGTPAAPPAQPDAPTRTWPLGEPDQRLEPAADFVMPADVQERVEEFTLDAGTRATRWLRAVDVLPGDPTVVRHATVSFAPDPNSRSSDENVLALWMPGEAPVPAPDGTGFLLPAGARLVLRVHYKKTWQRERDVVRDRSTVGLYFAPPGVATIKVAPLEAQRDAARQTPSDGAGTPTPRDAATRIPDVLWLEDIRWPWTAMASPPPLAAPEPLPSNMDTIVLTRTSGENRLLMVQALYADPGLQGVMIRVDLIRTNRSRDTLIAFRPQSSWARRYWFRDPVLLGPGNGIEVRATRDDAALLPPGAVRRPPADLTRVRLALDVTE